MPFNPATARVIQEDEIDTVEQPAIKTSKFNPATARVIQEDEGAAQPKVKQANQEPNHKKLPSFLAGVGAGTGQVALGLQNYLGKGIRALGGDTVGNWLIKDAEQGKLNLQKELDPYRQQNPFTVGAGEFVGNTVSTLPVGGVLAKGVSMIPGATKVAPSLINALRTGGGQGSNLASKAIGGAATGYVGSGLIDEDSANTGALLGAALPVGVSALSRVISPNASTNKSLQLLLDEGVRPTIGQTLGGTPNKLEQKLTSVLLAGDRIAGKRAQAVEDLNKAALNRVLRPIGRSADEIGNVGVKDAGDIVSDAYTEAASKIKNIKFDNVFANDFSQLKSMANGLTPETRSVFNQKINSVLGSRITKAGRMLPETFKTVDSELGNLGSRYKSSSVASEQELGDALLQAQSLLRQQAARSNPDYAKSLGKLDEAWANLVRVEAAAKYAQNTGGVFTPGQLGRGVKAADRSVRGRAVARGNALMQDLSSAGQDVLGNTVPDSGTAGRLLATSGVGGLLGAGVGTGSIGVIPAAAGLGGTYALYSDPVQSLLRKMVASRPAAAKDLANFLQNNANYLTKGVPAASAQMNNNKLAQ